MVFNVDYVKRFLLCATLAVTAGFLPMLVDSHICRVNAGSLDDNIANLLSTRKCPGCDLRGADLNGAELYGADLHGADLSGADLQDVDFSGGSNLMNVNFSNANLMNADLTGSNLNGANLSGAQVDNTAFVGVKGLTPEQKEDLRRRSAIVLD